MLRVEEDLEMREGLRIYSDDIFESEGMEGELEILEYFQVNSKCIQMEVLLTISIHFVGDISE